MFNIKKTHDWELEDVLALPALVFLRKQCKNQEQFEMLAKRFCDIQLTHYYSWGVEDRNNYTIYKLKKVYWSNEDHCFHAYYQKDWYHYDYNKRSWW